MQVKDCVVLVKSDFFLYEKNFQTLRDFISLLDYEEVQFLDFFIYDLENDEILHIHQLNHPNYPDFSVICDLIKDGYIALTFTNLKRMLSL